MSNIYSFAVPFAMASPSLMRAIALLSVRNMCRSVSKLTSSQLLHPTLLITSTNPNLLDLSYNYFYNKSEPLKPRMRCRWCFSFYFNSFSNSSISFAISASISRILAIISDVGGYSTATYSISLYLLMLRS